MAAVAERQPAVFEFVSDELQAAAGAGTIVGQGVTFGLLNDYSRVFVPGSLAASIAKLQAAKRSLPMGFQHTPFQALEVVGAWNGVSEDPIGLQLRGQISDTQAGRDAATLVRDGGISGISIGFRADKVQLAKPGENVTFQTTFGPRSYSFDSYVVARRRNSDRPRSAPMT